MSYLLNKKSIDLLPTFIYSINILLVLIGINSFYVWPQINYYYSKPSTEQHTNIWSTLLGTHETKSDLNKKLNSIGIFTDEGTTATQGKKTLPEAGSHKDENSSFFQTIISSANNATKNVHIWRASLMYPIIISAKLTNINAYWIFGVVIYSLLFLFTLMNFKTAEKAANKSSGIVNSVFLIMISLWSMTLNGRMLWAYISISALIYLDSHHRNTNNIIAKLVALLGILWLSSVSTGVLIIIYSLVICWLILLATSTKGPISSMLVLSLPLVIFLPEVYGAIHKNISYYGGDITALLLMLSHGLGMIMFKPHFTIALIIALPLLYFLRFLIPKNNPKFIILCVISGFFGSLYGYSVIMVSIPALLVLFQIKVLEKLKQE